MADRAVDRQTRAADPPAGAGLAYVAGFLVLANANAVVSGNLLQRLDPFTFLFWSFAATAVLFAAVQAVAGGRRSLAVDPGSAGPLALLNLTTAFNWIGYFVALRYVEPAIVSALFGGLGPVSTIAFERLVRHHRLPRRSYLAAAGILSGALLLVWAALAGRSGMAGTGAGTTALGLAAATAGGASQALNTIATKRLGDRGWSASRVMTHRFHLLVAVALVLALTGPGLAVSSSGQVSEMALATVLGVVAPLWLLQRGIIASEPFTVAALLALAPVLTYLFQGFDARLQWTVTSAMGCVVVTAFTVYSTRIRYLKGPR